MNKDRRPLSGRAADKRPQAGHDFLHMGWFGDVVVRTGVETLDLFCPTPAGGEDQNGHLATVPAPLLEHLHTLHVRQTKIQYCGIVVLGAPEVETRLAIGGMFDDEALAAQTIAQASRQ